MLQKGEIFHLVTLSPNGCNGQGWAWPKPGARTPLQVSHSGSGDLRTWALLYCFPRHISRKSNWEWSMHGSNPHHKGMPVSQMMALCHSANFNIILTTTVKIIIILRKILYLVLDRDFAFMTFLSWEGDLQRKKEKQRESYSYCRSTSQMYATHGARLIWSNKPEAFLCLLCGCRDPRCTWAIPGILARSWVGSRGARTLTSTHMGCWHCRWGLILLCQGIQSF